MILHEEAPIPYSTRIIKVILHPGLLFLKAATAMMAYFMIQEAGFTTLTKLLGFFMFFALLLLIFGYRSKLKGAVIQLVKLEMTKEGLNLQKQNRDSVEKRVIPMKELQIDLKKIYNDRENKSFYRLEMFEGDNVEPLFNHSFSNEEIAALLQKIDAEKWRPLTAEERDFLMWHERNKSSVMHKVLHLRTSYRKIATIIFLIIVAVLAFDNFFRDSQLTRYLFNLYSTSVNSDSGEWDGYWKVSTPYGDYTIEINHADSTIRDNVLHSTGKWKLSADPVISNETVAILIESGGTQHTITIAKKSANELTLSDGTILTKIYAEEPSTVSLFGKLKASLNDRFIITPGYEKTDSLYKAYIPIWGAYESGISAHVLARNKKFWITGFSTQIERQLVVSIDTVSETVNLGRYIDVQGVQGECSTNFSIESNTFMIKSEWKCMESKPVIEYYQVSENGNIVSKREKADEPEYVDEGFWFAPTNPSDRASHVSANNTGNPSDRNVLLEKFLREASPNIDIFPYGIKAIEEFFLSVLRASNATPDECDWLCTIKNFSGIDPIIKLKDSTSAFNYYNPEFITWTFSNLVPEPNEQFLNTTAHDIYIKSYRRAARIYTLAYCELYHLSQDLTEYDDATRQEGFYGPQYLKKYDRFLPEYVQEKNSKDDMILHPPQAFGFWLRRRMDNTNNVCWDGLSAVMRKYDPIWFKEKLEKYQIEVNE